MAAADESTNRSAESSLVVLASTGRREVEPSALRMEKRDFRHPVLLSDADLRRLRSQHVEFGRQLSAKVSASLRLEFSLSLLRVETMSYGQFTDALPDPAHLTLFKVEPLAGLGIINLPPALGLAITNRMLGGRGTSGAAPRALTEIETGLLEDVLRMIVDEWCRQWPDLPEPRPLLLGHETNGKFLQTAPRSTAVLVVSLEAALGETAKQSLQIAIPFAALAQRIKSARKQPLGDSRPAPSAMNLPEAWRSMPPGLSLPAVAGWRVADITVRDALELRVGDVLELPVEILTQTRMMLTGKLLFVGTAGQRNGRIAVRPNPRVSAESASSVGPHNQKPNAGL